MALPMSYGMRDNEPELQKMAAFLKERCDKGMYGLQYLNPQRTHIRIPWPTVPRANEEVTESCHMFTEWAYLSFRKRGNRGEQLETEPLSAQKHRFRNALARADGLRFCKELSSDGIRVYEFADTKREREASDNGNHRNGGGNSPSNYCLPSTPPNIDPSDSRSTIEYREWDTLSPATVTSSSSPGHTPGYQQAAVMHQYPPAYTGGQMPPDPVYNMDDGEQVTSLTTLLEDIGIPGPDIPTTTYQNNYQPYAPVDSTPQNYQSQNNGHLAVPSIVRGPSAPDHHLEIRVMYKGEEVMKRLVTNSIGFRVYSGNNIPDMSRLLDNEQRAQLGQLTRYHCEQLYGPDSIEQIEMPIAHNQPSNQHERTLQILTNMDRGLIFYMEHSMCEHFPYINTSLPSVYSIRLCQTRVFPYESNVQGREELEREGLKRMSWAKIFDAGDFVRQFEYWRNGGGPTPCATIKLSVGQKPKPRENNLVSISVTVAKAKALIDQHELEQLEDICISDKNSMDVAAQIIQSKIKSSFRIEDDLAQDASSAFRRY